MLSLVPPMGLGLWASRRRPGGHRHTLSGKAMGAAQVTTPIARVLRKGPRADEMGTWEAAVDFAFLAIASGAPGSACNAPVNGPSSRPARRTLPNASCGRRKWRGSAVRRSPRRQCAAAARRAPACRWTLRRPSATPIWKLEAALKCRSCRTPRYAPRINMIRLTKEPKIAPYIWVHLDDDR
jgi:hypothetical protein